MTIQSSVISRVSNGIAFLDMHYLNWRSRVSLGRLNLRSAYLCPLALAAGGRDYFEIAETRELTKETQQILGFLGHGNDDWDALEAEWKRQLS